jgi:hypothetical protein
VHHIIITANAHNVKLKSGHQCPQQHRTSLPYFHMINITSILLIMQAKGPRNTAHSSAETIIFQIMNRAISQYSAVINPYNAAQPTTTNIFTLHYSCLNK